MRSDALPSQSSGMPAGFGPFFKKSPNSFSRFSIEVPTKVLVPMVCVSGLSVLLRIVKHGTP